MKSLKVVFLSNWKNNPYKHLLINHLSPKGVQIEEYFYSLLFLPLIFRTGKPDLIHFHALHCFIVHKNSVIRFIKCLIFLPQIFFLNILNIKLVWTVHEWHDKINDGDSNITANQAAIIGRFFSGIITHCQTTKNEIITAFKLKNQEKVVVIPHGNYIDVYKNEVTQVEARKALGIPTENLAFLIFGGIYRYKGVLEAIDKLKKLQQQEIYLLIAGKVCEEELESTILSKIRGYKNILFFDKRIPDDEIQIYMNACDCLIVPYKVFTTSGVAILGMSYGRACIAPNTGFFSDTLDESGAFLYDLNHEDGLLHGMKRAIETKDKLAEMGRYNFKLAEKWNWNYVSEQTLNLYQYCLGFKL